MHQLIIVMRTGKTNNLIADARNYRHQHYAGSNTLQQAGPAQEGKNKHAYQHDNHQKVSAAARVQCAERTHIFYTQRQACLIGVNSFMLRTVILKYALNILHRGNRCNIGQENNHTQHALSQVEHHRILSQLMQKTHRPGRDNNKQTDSQQYGSTNSHRHLLACQLLVLFAGNLCRIGQGLDTVI